MPVAGAVDTSNNQGAAVVGIGPQLAEMGVEGWWHKATEGRSFRDKYWMACRAARVRNGLRYGGPYHWLSPSSSVAEQFANFEGFVGDLLPGECIQLDIEDPAGLSDAMVFEAVDRWEERYPGRVAVYTGRWYMPYKPGKVVLSYLIDRLIARYGADLKWWLPWYSLTYPGSSLPTTPVMWQWAGGAGGIVVDGVGHIDSNQIIDRDRLDLLCGYGDPFDPTEDDLTPEQAAHIDEQFAAIWNVLTQPIEGTTDPSMQWCAVLTYDMIAKGQLQDQIAAAVVAALPPASAGSLTVEQVTEAVKVALRQGTS